MYPTKYPDSNIAVHDNEKIKGLITKIKSDFIFLGLLLKEFNEQKQYLHLHYSNFESYLENELHMSKSTAYNLMAIHTRFGEGMNLKKQYKEYTYSQLSELVKYDDNQIKKFPPTMSVRQIKEKKKEIKDSKRLENIFLVNKINLDHRNKSFYVWDDVRKSGSNNGKVYIENAINELYNKLEDEKNTNLKYEISIHAIHELK